MARGVLIATLIFAAFGVIAAGYFVFEKDFKTAGWVVLALIGVIAIVYVASYGIGNATAWIVPGEIV
ncbi:MAG: hypothetical protein IJ133_04940 [Clostridia bacterium]|nr:hypothetical protein [Clostridia bacterium]